MDKKNNCQCGHHQNHGNGFMLGAVLGGAAVFLLGTKKGRAILRELSDKGLDAIENVKDLSNLEEIEEEVAEMGTDASQVVTNESADEKEPVVPTQKSRIKKFFKGVKKK